MSVARDAWERRGVGRAWERHEGIRAPHDQGSEQGMLKRASPLCDPYRSPFLSWPLSEGIREGRANMDHRSCITPYILFQSIHQVTGGPLSILMIGLFSSNGCSHHVCQKSPAMKAC